MSQCTIFSFCLQHLYEVLTHFIFPLYMIICYKNILLYKNNIKVISDQWKYIICILNFCDEAFIYQPLVLLKAAFLQHNMYWLISNRAWMPKGLTTHSHSITHVYAHNSTTQDILEPKAFQNVQIFNSVCIYLKFCVHNFTCEHFLLHLF